MEKKYCGVVVPMITPVDGHSVIEKRFVEKIIVGFSKAGVHPLLLGTTGEGVNVCIDDALDLIHYVKSIAPDTMTVYAVLRGSGYRDTVAVCDKYKEAGADVAVVTLPSYYHLTDGMMYNYYVDLFTQLSLPAMIYNIPSTTHMTIPLETIEEIFHRVAILKGRGKCVGIKDSDPDKERLKLLAGKYRDDKDFSVFCGCAANSTEGLRAGADGIVPSTGNFMPCAYRKLYDAALKGDWETAEAMQQLTNETGAKYQKGRPLGQQLAALKAVMAGQQLSLPWMIPPLMEIEQEERMRLVELGKTFKDVEL